jgi:mRNA export factor
VKCVKWSQNKQCLITGSWDNTIKFWDVKSNKCIDTYKLKDKVVCMDVKNDYLVVGTFDKQLTTFDLNNPSKPIQSSSIKSPLRCISIFEDNNGYVVGSTNGKCSVKYFDDSSLDYNFNCHVQGNSFYPVNGIDFNKKHGTFVTCGGSNLFNIFH